jgi:hypothetical protein
MHTAEQINAIVRRKYGTPDVLAFEVIERPMSLPRFRGRVSDRYYAAASSCSSKTAGLI